MNHEDIEWLSSACDITVHGVGARTNEFLDSIVERYPGLVATFASHICKRYGVSREDGVRALQLADEMLAACISCGQPNLDTGIRGLKYGALSHIAATFAMLEADGALRAIGRSPAVVVTTDGSNSLEVSGPFACEGSAEDWLESVGKPGVLLQMRAAS